MDKHAKVQVIVYVVFRGGTFFTSLWGIWGLSINYSSAVIILETKYYLVVSYSVPKVSQ